MTPDAPARGYLAEQLGAALVAARESSGLSRRQLAEQVGVTHITLRELEEGLANPTLKRIEETAALYGLEVTIRTRKARR